MERDTRLKNTLNGQSQSVGHNGPDIELLLDATKEAERVLEQEARAHPTYADVRHRLGLLHLLRSDPEGGEREFEEALGVNPDYRAAFYGLRLARMLQGIQVDKIEEKPEGSSSNNELIWWTIDEAYRCMLEGNDPVAYLCQNSSVDEQIINIYCGFFALKSGNEEIAGKWFEKAVNTSDIIKSALETMGILPWGNHDPKLVAKALQTVLWSPLACDLYTYLGRIYARNNLRVEGMNCFNLAYLVQPHDVNHAIHCAELAMSHGDENEAINLLKWAIEKNPTNVQARIALGYEYSSQGFIAEARTQFQTAVDLAPGYADVRYNLALIHVGENCLDEALDEFRTALSINPSYLPARHSMAHLLCRIGQYEAGLKEYSRILKQGFKSGDMLVQMGKAALAITDIDKSQEYLEQAIFLNPDYASSYYYLGQVYQRKGLKNKARSAWRNYLERANDWDPLGPVRDVESDYSENAS